MVAAGRIFPIAFSIVALAGCFPFGSVFDDDGGTVGYCSCPTSPGPCMVPTCEDGECVEVPIFGAPDSIQVAGDCAKLVCTGQYDPITVADPSDLADDFNECTVDACGDDGPTFTPLPAGNVCGDHGACTAAGDCVQCDDGNPCTHEECSSGALVVTSTDPPGTQCGANSVCSPTGECIECTDYDPCTTEECSTGVVVPTGVLPPGAACGDGEYCDAAGSCLTCSDANACTTDDCSTGTPVHTALPEGTSCGSGGAFCQANTCVTWCLPLPDQATCPDTKAYENGGADNVVDGGPQFPDDDGAPAPICGVLNPGDVDWVSYYAADRSFEYDVNDFLIWSYSESLRFCAFEECTTGTTVATCEDGGIPSTGPGGEPGCCWSGVFTTNSYISMNLTCNGTSEDSGWVYMRFDNPGSSCVPYALRDYGY